ncbi:MAG: gliding motility-associated C-terminal domain-containing protein [Chitinophagaceae bacterium]|nr:gliding motility-associated C-terminal domain-containing protein [Chitinophagaceae bacterium]
MGNVYTSGTFYTANTDFDPGPGVFNLPLHGQNDVFVTKFDPNGNFIWAINVGGPRQDISTGLTVDASGYAYVTGFFEDTADFDPGPAVFNLAASTTWQDIDVFILKLDPTGSFSWAKQIGGDGGQSSRSITLDGLGNVYTLGTFSGLTDFDPGTGVYNLTGSSSTFISKLDNAGNFIWAKTNYNTNYGGQEYPSSVAVDASNNVYFAGSFTETMDFDPGPGIYILTALTGERLSVVTKLDAAGNFQWVANAGSTLFYFAHSIDVDANGNTFLMKEQSLCKISPGGNLLWTKNIGGRAYEFSQSIHLDGNSNVYITGVFRNTVDFDPGPGTHNVTAYGSSSFNDAFVLRLDNNGNFVWVQQLGGNSEDLAYSIFVNPPGNIYSTGYFTISADFDPGPGVFTLTVPGSSNYIHKMSKCTNITSSIINAFACNSYTLNGQTYTTSGIYTQTLINAAGCDSILTLNLTIGGSNDTTSVTACDNYTWQGQTYTSSGFYRDTLVSSTGCDSILNLNLTINYKVLSIVNATICQGQTYAGHSSTGIYVDTYVAANGCDSIRTLNLTVSPVLYSTVAATICNNQNYAGHNISGIYIDTLVSVFGCDSIRTLNLTVNPRAFTLINVSICEGQTYYAGGANQTTSGIYKDTLLTSLGCDSIITTTLTVNPKPKPDLGPDRNLCVSSAAIITPGVFNSYLWQDNSTQSNFTVSSIGTYWVKVTDANNCTATDSLRVLAIDTVPGNFLPAGQTVCFGNEVKISLPGYKNYLWSTGSTSSNISLKNFGTFYLTVTDFNNCSGIDSITIQRANCIPMGIPNAFTPNGDGKNDVFKPTINQAILRFSFVIFNRYGETVFETREYGTGWDGTYKGKMQPTGSYVYRIKFTNINGWESENNGTVLLIR